MGCPEGQRDLVAVTWHLLDSIALLGCVLKLLFLLLSLLCGLAVLCHGSALQGPLLPPGRG